MRFVLDTNAALQLASRRRRPRGHAFDAPSLFASEAHSAIHESVSRGEIDQQVANEHRRRLVALGVRLHRSEGLVDRAWEIAERLGWAKTYGAEYVALAERLHVPLLTLDARLVRRLSGTGLVDIAAPSDVG